MQLVWVISLTWFVEENESDCASRPVTARLIAKRADMIEERLVQ